LCFVFGEIDESSRASLCERLIALAQESDAPIHMLILVARRARGIG